MMARDDLKDVLDDAIRPSPIASVVVDVRRPDNPIVCVNQAFSVLTGYLESEVIGRNCRFLTGPDTDPAHRAAIRHAVQQRQPCLTELVNYRKDGSPFLNAVMISPLRDESGDVAFFVGSQMDIGAPHLVRTLRAANARAKLASLTPRQREVLDGMKQGYLNKQIAWHLGVEEKTVKMHRAALIHRLGARSTAEALRIALEAEHYSSGMG